QSAQAAAAIADFIHLHDVRSPFGGSDGEHLVATLRIGIQQVAVALYHFPEVHTFLLDVTSVTQGTDGGADKFRGDGIAFRRSLSCRQVANDVLVHDTR